jgi:hypothetical protein
VGSLIPEAPHKFHFNLIVSCNIKEEQEYTNKGGSPGNKDLDNTILNISIFGDPTMV